MRHDYHPFAAKQTWTFAPDSCCNYLLQLFSRAETAILCFCARDGFRRNCRCITSRSVCHEMNAQHGTHPSGVSWTLPLSRSGTIKHIIFMLFATDQILNPGVVRGFTRCQQIQFTFATPLHFSCWIHHPTPTPHRTTKFWTSASFVGSLDVDRRGRCDHHFAWGVWGPFTKAKNGLARKEEKQTTANPEQVPGTSFYSSHCHIPQQNMFLSQSTLVRTYHNLSMHRGQRTTSCFHQTGALFRLTLDQKVTVKIYVRR